MTMFRPAICCSLAVLFCVVITGTVGSNVESCAVGWIAYQREVPYTCLYVSDSTTSTLNKAHENCKEKNASLIMIQSEEKMTFFKEIVQKYLSTNTNIWIGLQRSDSGEVTWLTKDGNIPAVSLPSGMMFSNWNYRSQTDGLIFRSNSLGSNYYGRDSRYICEKRSKCTKGWYGLGCDKQCHCHGEECDSTLLEVTCQFGCQIGWTGKGCAQPKEEASVRYFCVNSNDEGKYAYISIYTKGIHYENIHAVDEDGDVMSWCNNTVIENNKNTVTIKIYTDNNTDEAVNNRSCAGKIGEKGNYEWQLKIQEKDGIVSRYDQEVHIECDFSTGDKLRLSGDTEIKHERWFRRSDIKKPVEYLKEKKEKVKLEVVDPATGKTMSETQIGSPVVLRISYGFEEDDVATGVRPYNCDASSADYEQKRRFLDDKSCPVEGFPISAFSRDGTTKSLTTKPFSVFGFDGNDKVDFHCSYSLCFEDDPCSVSCDESQENLKQNETISLHKRSARHRPQRMTGTISVIKRGH